MCFNGGLVWLAGEAARRVERRERRVTGDVWMRQTSGWVGGWGKTKVWRVWQRDRGGGEQIEQQQKRDMEAVRLGTARTAAGNRSHDSRRPWRRPCPRRTLRPAASTTGMTLKKGDGSAKAHRHGRSAVSSGSGYWQRAGILV